MRIKAIPAEAVSAVKSHPVIAVAAVAVIGVFAYGHYSSGVAQQQAQATPDTAYGMGSMYSGIAPVSYSAPSGGGSGDFSSTNTSLTSAGQVSSSDLLDFEKLKEQDAYNLQMATLQNQADIAAAASAVQLAGISSANYQAASQLAQTFMTSGNDLGGGSVVGPNGVALVYNFANHEVDNTKGAIATNNFVNLINSHKIEEFMNQGTVATSNVVNNLSKPGSANGGNAATVYGVYGDHEIFTLRPGENAPQQNVA